MSITCIRIPDMQHEARSEKQDGADEHTAPARPHADYRRIHTSDSFIRLLGSYDPFSATSKLHQSVDFISSLSLCAHHFTCIINHKH